MVHRNSLANLRPPWKPGESGNPRGDEPGPDLRGVAQHFMGLPTDGCLDGPLGEHPVALLYALAIGCKNWSAMKLLLQLADESPKKRKAAQHRARRR
jgi:hypothetical protein